MTQLRLPAFRSMFGPIAFLFILAGCARDKIIGAWALVPSDIGQSIRFFDDGTGLWADHTGFRCTFNWRIDEAWNPDRLVLNDISGGPFAGKTLTATPMTNRYALTLYRIETVDANSPNASTLNASTLDPMVFERMTFCGGSR